MFNVDVRIGIIANSELNSVGVAIAIGQFDCLIASN